jgi:hypothetical protein
MIFLSETLIGESIGLAETEAGDWLVRFANINLGTLNQRSKKLRRFTPSRPPLHPQTPGPAQLGPPPALRSARLVAGRCTTIFIAGRHPLALNGGSAFERVSLAAL